MVVSKSNDEISIKHGVKSVLYLNVQFNKSGFKSIECSPTTYFSVKKGENICFNLDYERDNSINIIIGYMSIGIIVFILIVWLIYFILPDSLKE